MKRTNQFASVGSTKPLLWFCLMMAAVLAWPENAFSRAAEPAKGDASNPGKLATLNQPNILFFFADDWGRDASCYANPNRPSPSDVVQTPNIDRVAREGVRFNNAFYGCPQCTPSRYSIASGCYFWRCGSGAFLMGGEWAKYTNPFSALPLFPHLLGKTGYVTAKAFKTLPFTPTIGKAADDYSNYLRYGLYVSKGQNAAARTERRNEIIAQTRESLAKVLTACPPDKPFFFVFGPINTHRPYAPGSGKALWGIEPDALKGKLPAYLPDVPELRADYADYLGEVQALDLIVGIFLEELQKAGRLDNTLIVLTGDNGVPGFPRGKTQLYNLGCAAPLLVRWPGHIKPGRTVDDLINLMDLAPTFLELAGVKPPEAMDGQSLVPQLLANKSGLIDPARDAVVFGRERHHPTARAGNLPYPSRAICTKDFLYIRNFKPDRWPYGEPFGLNTTNAAVAEDAGDYGKIDAGAFRDMEPNTTKQWLVAHRNNPAGERFYTLAFGKRPAEELYDQRNDPDHLHNLAGLAEHENIRQKLSTRLMRVLSDTKDPRLTNAFDAPPYIEANANAAP